MSLSYPTNFICADTETSTIKPNEDFHEPRLIVGVAQYVHLNDYLEVDDYDEIVFNQIDQYWDFVFDKAGRARETHLYAHNWSFDFPVLDGFNRLSAEGYKLLSIVDASPPIILRYSKDGQRITVVDTLNYYRDSLKNIGKSVGHKKIDIDLGTATVDQLIPYCRADTDIVRHAVIQLCRYLKDNDLSRLTHTVSSLALSTYVRRFMPVDVMIDGNEKRVAVSRESYFGGRTECFRLGSFDGPFYLIDVNSMYPFVMRNNDYPVRTTNHWKRCRLSDLDKLVYDYCVTARVKISTNIPVFPLKIGGRTCFPVGTYETVLSTPEVIYGLEHDLIVSVSEIVLHQKGRIFHEYVDFFYNQRLKHKQENNNAYQEFDKKMLNTLYGKFGQTGEQWESTADHPRGYPGKWETFDIPTMSRIRFMELDGIVYRSISQPESRDSSPAIAAHVTAQGRILLQRTIDYVGRRRVYYCDTDSLLVDADGYRRICGNLDKRALGAWSLDGEYESIEIRGLKDYRFGEKERIKGIRKDHVLTKQGLYRQLQFSSLKGTIRRGVLDRPVIKHIEKKLNRGYSKGRVGKDGVVSPFVLKDGVLDS